MCQKIMNIVIRQHIGMKFKNCNFDTYWVYIQFNKYPEAFKSFQVNLDCRANFLSC